LDQKRKHWGRGDQRDLNLGKKGKREKSYQRGEGECRRGTVSTTKKEDPVAKVFH